MEFEMNETEIRDYIRRMISPVGIEKSPVRGGAPRQGKRKEVQCLHYSTSAEGCKHEISAGKKGEPVHFDREGRSVHDGQGKAGRGIRTAHQGSGNERSGAVGQAEVCN